MQSNYAQFSVKLERALVVVQSEVSIMVKTLIAVVYFMLFKEHTMWCKINVR